MLDCQISLLNYMATMHFISGKDPYPIGNSHFVHVPYNTFSTSDGQIVIAVITDNFWQNLKQVVQVESLDKPEYDTQPGRFKDQHFINATLNEILTTQRSSHWLGLLEAARIPCAPVNKFSQALSDPQVLHRNMVVELSDPEGYKTKGPGNPIKFSRSNEESFSAAPSLGEHTDKVLHDLLGMSPEDVSILRAAEVVN
jgi:CoA:oxalate CoA-transferase